MSDTWEVVGNTLYLRKPAPSAPSREHVDWIAFPGYAEAAHRICAERNKAVAALEARLAEVAPVVEAADRLVAESDRVGGNHKRALRVHYATDDRWNEAVVDVEAASRAARAKRENGGGA